MQDYYSPHPRLVLGEPILLVGQVGAGVTFVARAVAARTGVSFGDVDRLVESRAGCSIAALLERDGPDELRVQAGSALVAALERRPCGVVAIEQLAFEAEALERARGVARGVYVRRPASVLLARIQRQLAGQPCMHPFQLGVPGCQGDLTRFLGEREAVLASAEVVLEAGERHPHAVADELIASLDRLTSVDRL